MTHLSALARKLGPFSTDGRFIWFNSAKGGKAMFAELRGWGYLTGGGHGALGMHHDKAIETQREWGNLIVEALNAYAANDPATAVDGVPE